MGVWQMWCSVCNCGFSPCCTYIYDATPNFQKKLNWLRDVCVIKNGNVYLANYDDYGRFGGVWDSLNDNRGAVVHKRCWDKILLFIPNNKCLDLETISFYFCTPRTGLQDWEISMKKHDEANKIHDMDYLNFFSQSSKNAISKNNYNKPKCLNEDKVFPFRTEIVRIIISFLSLADLIRMAKACRMFYSISFPFIDILCHRKILKTFDTTIIGLLENIGMIKKIESQEITWQEVYLSLSCKELKLKLDADENFVSYASSYIYKRIEEEIREKNYNYIKDEDYESNTNDGNLDEDDESIGDDGFWLKKKTKL